ncbi:MAG: hypothetical protein V4650_10235 [Pseudomonadota bacterium]
MRNAFGLLALALLLVACGDSGIGQRAAAPVTPPPPASVAKSCEAYQGPALSTLRHYEGLMHEHSSYSDGLPSAIPADYFRVAREAGYSFVGSSEHSDSLDPANFVALHAFCDPSNDRFDPTQLENCFLNPTGDNLLKWASTQDQASAANASGDFLAIRGFEWTSDVFGHINVYFSTNFTNAKTDGGYAVTMDTFWDWFTRDPATPGTGGSAGSNVVNGGSNVPNGGGSDALAHFNHPGDKCQTDNDPTGVTNNFCDWNDYTLIPDAVERMIGMEVYNDSNRDDRYHARYMRALDKGWKLAPIGSEDEHFGEYAVDHRPKTVTISASLQEDEFKAAWLARRSYALSPGWHLRAKLLVDQDHPMGSTLTCPAGAKVPLDVALTNPDGSIFTGEYRLFTSGGEQVGSVTGSSAQFMLTVPVAGEPARWYFVRVHGGPEGKSVAYLAPVWIGAK